jgi:ABC-2 type transport system permease protein
MEWTKLRTDPGTRWCALALIAGTLAVSALASWTTDGLDCTPRPCTVDATRVSLSGVYLGQIAVVVLAVLAISREYESTMIRTTLAASPRRSPVLLSKAGVAVATVAATAIVAAAATLIAARVIMGGQGFTPANGYPLVLSLADEPTRRAYLGTVLYLGLVALLSLGVAAIVRHTGAAIATMLGLLYVTPIAVLFVTDPLWQGRIRRYSPMTAGLAIQNTATQTSQPIAPWAGLGLLAAYASAAVVVGAILFHRRDA